MYRIGYTTGVFDLFHIGHLNILRGAKENCKYLIVAVSTDELVYEYKGKTPVIPFEERLKIVSSVKYVDEVVTQTTLDKISAWEQYRYNILFQGSDWVNSKAYMPAKRFLDENNIKIMLFPYTVTTSSTLLTKTLRSFSEDS